MKSTTRGRFACLALLLALGLLAMVSGAVALEPPASDGDDERASPVRRGVIAGEAHDQRPACVVVPDVSRIATLYADGRRITVPIEHRWRSMCYLPNGAKPMSQRELLQYVAAQLQDEGQFALAGPPDDGDIAGEGFNLVFDTDASVPSNARDALDRVEAYYEKQFDDDITVTVNVEFDDSLPGGVLGATSTPFTHALWNTSRVGLRNGMDDTDKIHDFLPPLSTIPVRYNGNSPFATDETRVFWSIANFNATVGFVSGDAGSLRFNEDIQWDYNPDNGVIGYSFIDVVVHEVGHALGFGSGVDFRKNDIEALDIFRFQRTDGTGDYNPDSYAEFQTTARLVDKNLPNNDAISDLIIAQYKMEDGIPYQASHFYDKQPAIGIMDPVLGQGQTFWPGYFTTADKRMFDAIGWDR